MPVVELASRGPQLAFAIALALWLVWTAWATPWAARLPPASAAELAAWPPRTPAQESGLRLATWSFATQSVGQALILGGLMTPPGARLLGRTHSVAIAATSIGVALTAVRLVACLLAFMATRRLVPTHPSASPRWWWPRVAVMVYLVIAVPGLVVAPTVNRLHSDPDSTWLLVVLVATAFVPLVVARWAIGSVALSSAPSTERLREIGATLLPITGVRRVRLVVGTTKGAHHAAAVVARGGYVVAVRPDVLETTTAEQLTGLVAHELAHVKHRDGGKRFGQSLLATIAGTLAGLAAVSTPALRHAVGAGDVADSRLLALALGTALLTWRLLRATALLTYRRQEALADWDALRWVPPGGIAPFLRTYVGSDVIEPRWPIWKLLVSAGHPNPVDRLALPETANRQVFQG